MRAPRKNKSGRKTRAAPKGAAASRQDAQLSNALAEAAWREADAALASALVECADLEIALASPAKTRAAKARINDAVAVLSQSLARAARKRGLARFGAVGEAEAFDAARHELKAKRAPKRVKIVMSGVARGAEVLIRAQAEPARAAKRSRA